MYVFENVSVSLVWKKVYPNSIMNISAHSNKQNLNLFTTVSGFIKKKKGKQTQLKQIKSNKEKIL